MSRHTTPESADVIRSRILSIRKDITPYEEALDTLEASVNTFIMSHHGPDGSTEAVSNLDNFFKAINNYQDELTNLKMGFLEYYTFENFKICVENSAFKEKAWFQQWSDQFDPQLKRLRKRFKKLDSRAVKLRLRVKGTPYEVKDEGTRERQEGDGEGAGDSEGDNTIGKAY
ncbi:hypothetical protein T440DRAFT_523281 [Plenodomus tracheiphilus IPT5]|uniref:Uncharacterized protein n=1 Tax=Plenodomus tracheiphilus IPT5 TaxID=1408161 RepID=A0A6A7APS1_9PLEO|nr:hypothetical protein T440DRAFT_523281 [Plenodomus tracheiphilus IPT5]